MSPPRSDGSKTYRVLSRLAPADATAQPTGEGFSIAQPGRGRPATFDRALAEQLAASGLVRADRSGRLEITEEGRAWLRRRAADDAPFAAQHRLDRRALIKEADGSSRPVVVNDAESPLAWLHRRRGRDGAPLISAAQFRAGERFREDYERARVMPGMTQDWSMVVSRSNRRGGGAGGMADLTDATLAARERVRRAYEAVGPELAGLVVDVCCFLKGLERVETERYWPRRSAKVILAIALGRLADHYGLEG